MKFIFGQSQRHLKWAAGWKVRLPVLLLVVLLSSLLFATPAAAALSISPYSLSDGQVDVTYPTTTLTVYGGTGPYSWSYSGSFPNGLIFTSDTGASATISGTPTLAGDYHFSVTVEDATLDSITMGYTITVAEEPITFTTTTMDDAEEGTSYSEYIYVSGGTSPYTFSLVSGALPSGLTLDATNGIILGTPTNGSAGTYVFTIGVTDSSTSPITAQYSFSLVVESGYYESVIRVGVSLAAGETRVYFDGVYVATLEGGETLTRSFAVGDEPVITVDSTVSSPTRSDVRYIADEDEIVVDEENPDATFSYTTEYYIDLKTDPSQITTLTGADWFEVGEFI